MPFDVAFDAAFDGAFFFPVPPLTLFLGRARSGETEGGGPRLLFVEPFGRPGRLLLEPATKGGLVFDVVDTFLIRRL